MGALTRAAYAWWVTQGIVVRRALESDYEAMCRLLDEADAFHRERVPWLFREPSAPPRDRAHFSEFWEGARAVAFVAEAGDVVGVVLGFLRETPSFPVFRREQIGVIDALAVDSAWRRQGAGTLLARAVESWAIDQGAAWVELNVYQANPEAMRFYERLGFAPVSSKLRKVGAEPRWTIWRQDDNGNQSVISSGHSRDEAARLCAEFEARGHKQLYWIAPDASASD